MGISQEKSQVYLRKFLSINTSLDYIRQSHIIHFINGGQRTNNEKALVAAYCGYSVQEQSKYYKYL